MVSKSAKNSCLNCKHLLKCTLRGYIGLLKNYCDEHYCRKAYSTETLIYELLADHCKYYESRDDSHA